MKTSQEKLKAEFLAKADVLFDELMTWDEQTPEPNLTQIEEIVLRLRQQLGEQMTQAMIARQEKRQPAETVRCPKCQGVAEPKGQKGKHVGSRLGNIRLERSYYYCPRCQEGFFPPG